MNPRFLSASRTIVAVSVALVIGSAVVITPWMSFPFVAGRALFAELVILAALPFWAALLLADPASRPPRHPITIVLALQGLLLFLAAVFGVDFVQSFWGRDERMMGVFTLLLLLAFFGMAVTALRNARAAKWILIVVISTAWVNIIWGLLEHFFPAFWSDFRGGSNRVVGLFGNSVFYGGYMLGVAGLAAAACARVRSVVARIVCAVTAALAALTVLYSGTRGAGLGLFAGAGAALLAAAVLSRRRAVRVGALAGIAFIVATLVFFAVFRDAPFLKPIHEFRSLRRLGSAFSLEDASASQRLSIWKVTLEGIRERPILGWGSENFDYVFDSHFDPALLRFTIRETFADRPHNGFLEAGSDAGIFGFLVFVAFFGVFCLSAIRLRRSAPDDALRRAGGSVALASALLGFAAAVSVNLLFSFHTLSSLTTLLLVSAWLVTATDERAPSGASIASRRSQWVIPAVSAISLFLIIWAVILPSAAFTALHRANTTDVSKNSGQWLSDLRRAAAFPEPYQNATRLRVGRAVFDAVGGGTLPEELVSPALAFAREELTTAARHQPDDYGIWFTLGNINLLSAMAASNAEWYAEAERAFLAAAERSPRRQSTYFQLGNLKIVSGDAAGSIRYFQIAVDLDPSVAEPHWHLGKGLLKTGEKEEAAVEIIRALDLGFKPKLKSETRDAASLFFGLGRAIETVRLYEFAVDASPRDPELWAELAAAYAYAGDRVRAGEAVARAVELDPSYAGEAEAFLNLLDSGELSSPPQEE